ncbi:filamentous hemagglutinin N-terminal domain-containing protein [Pseudomonas sp. MM211]|uniref:GLUG motif-containing protein n=1 Tax=Pseudomonas sp. MM211 TaxID=2866808 RepID=UPI001CED9075|nr:GLUG motif-containing protein [Pseudomonas sp. MM211]UCJ17470.1 filamentous hemagglutinin N-terminal domain-containing protein [Pseudomonas sp. MM211]
MNRTYALVWNPSLATWSVANEHARRRGKGAGAVLVAALLLPVMAFAADLPTGGQVVSGNGQIGTPSNNQMIIDQASNKLAINWQSFDIAAGNKVTFNQPGSDSIALNRVLGADGSKIMGQLDANGRVFIINPNGVLFGQGAQVNVGGLVASTLDISNSDFEAGNYQFKGNGSNASVINNGKIIAADGGAVALLGGTVSNNGVIVANQGSVALAAGNTVTLDFAGDGLLNVQVDEAVLDALVENHQLIKADGGQVLLTANAGEALLKTVVNNTGVIEAQTLGEKDGKIVLLGSFDGGSVQVAGTLDASAPNGGNGGFIETSGAHVKVADIAKVTTKAQSGKTGTWLIDPNDFTVAASGGNMTGAAVSTAVQNNNFEIQTATMGTAGGDGDIHINDAITWNSNNTLTLTAERNININSAITATGASAGLVLNYGGSDYQVAAPVTLSGANASLAINGTAYTLIHSMAQLDDIDSTGLSGHYALAQNLDASGTTYDHALVGTSFGSSFTGTFAGLGHTISDLTISASGSSYIGLFGVSSGIIRDIGLGGGSITGADGSNSNVGGLVGYNQGSITNAFSTGNVNGNGGDNIGGLVGYNTGSISKAYATGTVTGGGTSRVVGGLVGGNEGGSISNAYATGNVSGRFYVGGLAGTNDLNWGGSINNAYATGSVTGDAYLGGLVGEGRGATTNSFYATTDANGNAISNGDNGKGIGKTWAELNDASTFATWDFANTWRMTATGAGTDGYAFYGLPTLQGVTRKTDYQYFDSGLGTQANPWAITNWQQLHNINLNTTTLGGHFTLNADLNQYSQGYYSLASATANGGAGWNTLGGAADFFAGTFDGQNHTLSDLTINASGPYVGLFGFTDSSSVIRNIGLLDASVTSGGNDFVGALVGFNQGAISNAYATGSVEGRGYVGGLVGLNTGTISSAYATVSVTGLESVGGLVGINNGSISSAYASGDVAGDTSVGGLVGLNNGSISNAYATGNVTATGDYVGGLIGRNVAATLNNVHATGSVTGAGRYLGGLAGYSKSTLQNAYATGNVTGTAPEPRTGTGDYVGGLIGYSEGTISNAYATGNVIGKDRYIGGLVGYSTKDISNAHATGSSTGGYGFGGGLVGYSLGAISNAYATGNVRGAAFTGGLVGRSDGSISNAYATGSVSGSGNVGGLAGRSDGIISNAYATGSVAGIDYTGGLVGNNTNDITNAYATGAVTAWNGLGGLVGVNTGRISNAYATGSVKTTMAGTSTGALVGDNRSAITNSFWNSATSGTSAGVGTGDSSGVTAKTTTQMQTLSFFQNDLGWSIAVNTNAGPVGQPRLSPSGSSTIWQVSVVQPAVIPFSSQLYSGALSSNGQTMTSESSLQIQESVAISADMLVTTPLDEHLNLQVINHGIRLPEGI